MKRTHTLPDVAPRRKHFEVQWHSPVIGAITVRSRNAGTELANAQRIAASIDSRLQPQVHLCDERQ